MPEDFTSAALAVDEMMAVVSQNGPIEDEMDELPAGGNVDENEISDGRRIDGEEEEEEDDSVSPSSLRNLKR